jgi:hypothetical protein
LQKAWIHQLEAWHEFFVLAGIAGVTLTGLLFVVVSLGPRVVALLQARVAMNGVAATLILLLVIGIRNAWHLVIWISQKEHR